MIEFILHHLQIYINYFNKNGWKFYSIKLIISSAPNCVDCQCNENFEEICLEVFFILTLIYNLVLTVLLFSR